MAESPEKMAGGAASGEPVRLWVAGSMKQIFEKRQQPEQREDLHSGQ